ncbi:MAG: hypothetical protein M1827_004689 [Pycnora praestabilis]|nr:MAG: hypothetical protein M1827_004689 [Pycnora praestabilis]
MRGKRSKQYRKLMQQYGMTFGFREPYQVLLDAEMIQDVARFKMDLIRGLERTLHGKIKPMITQCSMRHLYTADPRVPQLIEQAKSYERRRCDHHTLDEPLSALECLSSVVDPKASRTNKHRYVVASQESNVRAYMRNIPGVPLVYINRSVMIMEPMGSATENVKEKEERGKFRVGLTSKRGLASTLKRKRDEANQEVGMEGQKTVEGKSGTDGAMDETEEVNSATKRKKRGPKGPNPLSVRKSKKRTAGEEAKDLIRHGIRKDIQLDDMAAVNDSPGDANVDESRKRKRKRKHKLTKVDDPFAANLAHVEVGA